jgi:hypothetical protein
MLTRNKHHRLRKIGFTQLYPTLYSSNDIKRFARKHGDDGVELFIIGKVNSFEIDSQNQTKIH